MKNLNRISLSGLRAIEAVARLGSLSAAANELGVTPGALSQRISRTEEQLDRQVFLRTGGGLRLTGLGQEVVIRLSRGMTELSAAVSLTEPTEDDFLNLSTAPLLATRWLIWRLPHFTAAHPDIRIRIEPVAHMVVPGAGGIDVGVRIGKGEWPGLRIEKLLDLRAMPVCAPSIAQQIKRPEDLLTIPILRENEQLAGWREWLAPHKIDVSDIPDGPILADGGLCLDAAISGQGVFMSWEIPASYAIEQGQLVAPLPGLAKTENSYWFVTAAGARHKPAIAKFRDWLRRELTETAQDWPG